MNLNLEIYISFTSSLQTAIMKLNLMIDGENLYKESSQHLMSCKSLSQKFSVKQDCILMNKSRKTFCSEIIESEAWLNITHYGFKSPLIVLSSSHMLVHFSKKLDQNPKRKQQLFEKANPHLNSDYSCDLKKRKVFLSLYGGYHGK